MIICFRILNITAPNVDDIRFRPGRMYWFEEQYEKQLLSTYPDYFCPVRIEAIAAAVHFHKDDFCQRIDATHYRVPSEYVLRGVGWKEELWIRSGGGTQLLFKGEDYSIIGDRIVLNSAVSPPATVWLKWQECSVRYEP